MNELVYIPKIRFNSQKKSLKCQADKQYSETLTSCIMSCGISMNFTMQTMHLIKNLPSIVPKRGIGFYLREDLAHNWSRKTVRGHSNNIAKMVPCLCKLRKHRSPAFPLPPPLLQLVLCTFSQLYTELTFLAQAPECEASGVKTEAS